MLGAGRLTEVGAVAGLSTKSTFADITTVFLIGCWEFVVTCNGAGEGKTGPLDRGFVGETVFGAGRFSDTPCTRSSAGGDTTAAICAVEVAFDFAGESGALEGGTSNSAGCQMQRYNSTLTK